MSRLTSTSSYHSRQRPTSLDDVDLNASRVSNISQGSQGSTITLGGVEYHVGSRLGKSGMFVIGDPRGPSESRSSNRSSMQSVAGSGAPMVKEGQYPYINKGYDFEHWAWPSIRFGCLIVVFAIMIALLAATIGLSIQQSEKCNIPFLWWKGSTIYHIPVRYFNDFNNDDFQTGDIRGVQERIEYFNEIGVEVISLSQFMPHADPKWKHQMSFTGVDERVGDVNQFQALVQEAHSLSTPIRVLVELSLVSTAKDHEWFLESRQQSLTSQSRYKDFYLWSNSPLRTREFRDGDWMFDILRQQYYFHRNNTEQPLLNWTSTHLKEAGKEILEYWLKAGVDGFVVRDLDKMYALSLDDTKLTILDGWREMLDSYGSEGDDKKILVIEDTFIRHIEDSYLRILPFVLRNVDLIETPIYYPPVNTTNALRAQVERGLRWKDQTLSDISPWISWRLTNLSNIDDKYLSAMQLFVFMLPGTPAFMAGEEVNLFYWEETRKNMKPMLWSAASMRPYNPDLGRGENFVDELRDTLTPRNREYSLRQHSVIGRKEFEFNIKYHVIDDFTILFERHYGSKDAYYYAANFGWRGIEKDWLEISPSGSVVSGNRVISDKLNMKYVFMDVGQAIIFKTIE